MGATRIGIIFIAYCAMGSLVINISDASHGKQDSNTPACYLIATKNLDIYPNTQLPPSLIKPITSFPV